MNIKNQKTFIDELNNKMAENSEQGFEFFKESWPKLDNDDRKMLTTLITVGVGQVLGLGQLPLEDMLHWLAVANFTDKPIRDNKIVESDDDDYAAPLALARWVTGKQVTKIFRDLKLKGAILSSYDDIADAIADIFPIDRNTAYNDLTQSSRMEKVVDLLP
ncbi:MAG: hypothetical protein ACHQF0_10870 [Chitinophagales bacterium]